MHYGLLVDKNKSNNSIQGYFFKADIYHYFDNVDHEILIRILERKINDTNLIYLIRKVLLNFNSQIVGRSMPLGNYTSQFFANVYLNELDYFVKNDLKAKFYIRYVDDFIILHKSRRRLEFFKTKIDFFLKNNLGLKLHPDKSNIIPLQKGVPFLGYKIFYKHKILRKRNRRYFLRKLDKIIGDYQEDNTNQEKIISQILGWSGYAKWANTYLLRKEVVTKLQSLFLSPSPPYWQGERIRR